MKSFAEIVLATRNPGKVAEIQALLGALPVETLSLSAFPDLPETEEDFPTIEGNAIKKAKEASKWLGLPAIADDTALEVDHLNGRPGVHSARFAGTDSDPVANRALLLALMDGVGNRQAQFRTVVAFVEGAELRVFEGSCRGHILTEERGEGGFGYDALFVPDGENRTFAEMDLDEKNRISHRARALARLLSFLTERFDQTPKST